MSMRGGEIMNGKVSEIIMIDSPEAAGPHTMDGWLSCNGYFSTDEDAARYAGCTHRPCMDCGEPSKKTHARCEACRDKRELARYKARKRKAWDGMAMIYSEALDRYFVDPDDAIGAAMDYGIEEPMLLICEPEYSAQITEDFFQDQLPEDGDLPTEILAAMNAFNAAVSGVVLSWVPGEFALDLEGEE